MEAFRRRKGPFKLARELGEGEMKTKPEPSRRHAGALGEQSEPSSRPENEQNLPKGL